MSRQMKGTVGEAPNVLVALGANATHWIVGGVIRQLGEQLLPNGSDTTSDDWEETHAIGVVWRGESAQLEDRREEIDIRHESGQAPATTETTGTAPNEAHLDAGIK